MTWLIASYQPVGLFSLKHGEATSTGGKSLLIPTPFAIRTALVDAALRLEGQAQAEAIFTMVKGVTLALKPPSYAAVSALFAKVLKPERADSGKASTRFFQKTIAFREYIHWWGPLRLAFGGERAVLERLRPWLTHITYLGKRGGFVQLLQPPEWAAELPEGFLPLHPLNLNQDGFPLGLVQRVDEWGPGLTWAKLNVYSGEKIRLSKERLRFDVATPYTLRQAGRGFALYTLTE